MKLIAVYGAGSKTLPYRFEGTARIADALFALPAGFSMPCGGHGRCGACKARITGGVLPPDDSEKRLLSESELGRGIRLCCRAVANGDCEVFLPGETEVSVMIRGPDA